MAVLRFLGLVHAPIRVHLKVKNIDLHGTAKMTLYSRFSALIDALSAANHYEALFRQSDADLAKRGLSREGLTRSYISGLGAR